MRAGFGSGAVAAIACALLLAAQPSAAAALPGKVVALWDKHWGGPLVDSANCMAIANESGAQYIYIAGTTNSYGGGKIDAMLLKYNLDGSLVWETVWGGPENDIANGICAGNGSVYVTGKTESFGPPMSNVFVLRFDSNGTLVGNVTWGGSSDEAGRACLFHNGSLYVTGLTYSFTMGLSDIFLAKYTPDLSAVENSTWGGLSWEDGYGIAAGGDGLLYVCGYTKSYGNGLNDFLIARFTESLAFQGDTEWGSAQDDMAYRIIAHNGSLYLGGLTRGWGNANAKCTLVRMAYNGTEMWSRTWGGEAADDVAYDLCAGGGTVWTVGETKSYGAGLSDAVVLRYAENGTALWSKTWGSANLESAKAAQFAKGTLYVAGSAWNATHTSPDAFILGCAPDADASAVPDAAFPATAGLGFMACVAALFFARKKENA